MSLLYKKLKKHLLPLVILILGVIAFYNGLDYLINAIGMQKATHYNTEYLETSFDKSVKGFLILSSIKSGLAVLEGSEIGVGFNLEIGDLVQSIYDYVDIAWKTALAGSTILLLMRLLFLTIGSIDHYFLALLLFFLSGFLYFSLFFPKRVKLNRLLKEIVLFFLVLTVTLYFILPFSISGAAFLSKRITLPLINDATAGFSSVQHDLSPESLSERLFESSEEKGLLSRLNVPKQLHNMKERIKETGVWLKDKMDDMAMWTIKLVAGYLFDCIVFPFTFFFILFIFSKGIMGYVLGLRRDKSLKDDLHTLFEKYYGRENSKSKNS
jgi:hypothetical protein